MSIFWERFLVGALFAGLFASIFSPTDAGLIMRALFMLPAVYADWLDLDTVLRIAGAVHW